jgi:4-aminobutyrate aminotransferase-like enzyme
MPHHAHISGRNTRRVLELLRRYESRNVTFMTPDGSWPIVWERARGLHVWDAEGRKYLDLTAAFGVAAAGHANPRVIRAARQQMARLPHAMGDVHPHAHKAELARALSRLTFERWTRGSARANTPAGRGKVIFGSSGFEAVEMALKTAHLGTGRRGIVAFEGGYHGLGYGALNATHRPFFRQPFLSQLGQFGQFGPFPVRAGEVPAVLAAVEAQLKKGHCGAVLVEPVQARGGIRVPPPGFLPGLRQLCDACCAWLIVDEIYTGFGRTGTWFACEQEGVIPDIICLGKALTGGFPLSACVGRADFMDRAWPPSQGEAIHTSTFLGNPVGCAMALAQIQEIREKKLVQHSARLGARFLAALQSLGPRCGELELEARGRGLMLGLELRRQGRPAGAAALAVVQKLLHQGFLVLPEGEQGEVISFTPPLILAETHMRQTLKALREALAEAAGEVCPRSRP